MYELLNFVDGIENKIVFGETFGSKTKFTYRWFSLFQRNALLFASKSKLNHWRSLPIWKLKNSIRKYNWIFNSPKHWRVLIPSFFFFCLLPITVSVVFLHALGYYTHWVITHGFWIHFFYFTVNFHALRALGWVITHFFAKFF